MEPPKEDFSVGPLSVLSESVKKNCQVVPAAGAAGGGSAMSARAACSGLEPLRGQFWSRRAREWKYCVRKWAWEVRPAGCSVRSGPARLPAQQVRAKAEASDVDGYLGVPGRVQERGFSRPPCICLISVGMRCSRGYPKLLVCLHRCSSTAGTIGSFLRA
jgi:hypothetical protein